MRPVRVVVAGSVDDGKSTLLGRLMCDAQSVFADELVAVRLSPAPRGGEGKINLAFFTDGLMHEREHGITLDVAWRHLTLGTRRLLLADVPGHAELIRNMATGASTADAALLLVDAERGLQPQTRRHLLMLNGLGVKTVVVCLNKMDAVAFDESIARDLGDQLRALAPVEVIPVSALDGDNIVRRSDRMPWYAGPTVAQRLEAMQPVAVPVCARAVVQLDTDESGWTSLHVLSGAPGDVMTSWPAGLSCRLLERSPQGAGRVRLETPQRRGTLLTSPHEPPRMGTHVNLIVTWLGPGECTAGLELQLLQHGRKTTALVSPESGALFAGDVGHVQLALDSPTWFDRWEDCAPTGTCLLVDTAGRTVAGGRFT